MASGCKCQRHHSLEGPFVQVGLAAPAADDERARSSPSIGRLQDIEKHLGLILKHRAQLKEPSQQSGGLDQGIEQHSHGMWKRCFPPMGRNSSQEPKQS